MMAKVRKTSKLSLWASMLQIVEDKTVFRPKALSSSAPFDNPFDMTSGHGGTIRQRLMDVMDVMDVGWENGEPPHHSCKAFARACKNRLYLLLPMPCLIDQQEQTYLTLVERH